MFSLIPEYLATIHLGIENVRAHKMRSILTVLGIVFGVCSVISMLSIGQGASAEVQEQLNRLGSTNIMVKSVKPPQNPNEQSQDSGSLLIEYGLTYRDAERIKATFPDIEVQVPIKTEPADMWVKNRKLTRQLMATVPWIQDSQPIKVTRGRFITPMDLERRSNVIVISESVARELFRYADPLGQPLKVGTDVYRVVGVMHSGGGSGGGSSAGVQLASDSADAIVPITTLRTREGDTVIRSQQGGILAEKVELSELILKVKNVDDVESTAAIIDKMLASSHPKGDYRMSVPLQLLEGAKQTKRIFSMVLSSIAAISLLVGGIGIMNIMLASVSERTREIGVRRALGARRRDIMAQFLVETLILSVGGGLLGMALGAIIPWLVTHFFSITTILTADAFILSFAVSAVVGVVFGLYPARRAAMMDPIEALRHE